MSNPSIKYGILLTKEQFDFLKDDRQGFHRMTAFDTFVSMASIKPSVYQKTGFSASLFIGQFAISTVELSALWKCDRKTAAKVVELFNQVGILSTERNNRTSIHTILCIAFWYVDGIKEAIKNPFYNRQAVTSATQEKSVSDVPSDTAYSSGGNLSNGTGQQKDSSVNPATTDIQQPHAPAPNNTASPFVNPCVIGDGLSDPSPIPQDFKQREEKGDTCFEYEVGLPSEDDYNQGEETPYVELLPPPVYDDEGCLLQPPADESLYEENTEWQDAHNTPRHS
ncbi:hypothetical protein DWX88_01105 [Bacteroides xylanisolvens]|jgi:hypothetical protein|nr:hypothetical protein DWX88_01105 [Bacteroides xylanisolvens]